MTLTPNALQSCGTPAARRRHLAHAEACTVCGTPWPPEPDYTAVPDPPDHREIMRENA